MKEIKINNLDNPIRYCILTALDDFDLNIDRFNKEYQEYIQTPEIIQSKVKQGLEEEYEDIMNVIGVVRRTWEQCSNYWINKINNKDF